VNRHSDNFNPSLSLIKNGWTVIERLQSEYWLRADPGESLTRPAGRNTTSGVN